MLKLLWTAIGGNKLILYIGLGLGLLAVVVTSIARIKKSGADAERSKQLQDALSSLQKEHKRNAEIESLNTDVARQQLRDRWSKH